MTRPIDAAKTGGDKACVPGIADADMGPDSPREPEVQRALDALRNAVVMIVDDESVLIDVLQASLEEEGYANFVTTTDPLEAIGLMKEAVPDVLLLDVVMPGLNGLEILRRVRSDRTLCHTPVIVLTASSDPKVKLQALELGAADFLSKPVDGSELVLRLRNTLAAKAYQDRLAFFDPVTGLPNRRLFMDRLEWACGHARRYGNRGALLHVDMDRFKQVNDALGPGTADLVLKQVGERLAQCIGTTDSITRLGRGGSTPSLSRLGGDEFSVLLPDVDTAESAAVTAGRMLEALHDEPFHNGGQEIFLSASIGVAVFPEDGEDVDTVMNSAGAALREAKHDGRRQFKFYSKAFNARARQRLGIETELRRALERDELRLHFQPKVDTASQAVTGAEALVRWEHPERGLIGPMEFIPVAESSGLILPLGEWVFHAACRQVVAWRDAALIPVPVSVNVSSLQLRDPGFIDAAARVLGEMRLAPGAMSMELTETVILDKSSRTARALERLHGLGIKLSIDDFGAGFTSLSYLKHLPFSEVKIDKSFVDGIETDSDSRAIVAAVIALAHNLGLSVVAEGVETQAQHAFLQGKGCNECQGYLFSRPVSADAFQARLRQADGSSRTLRAVG